MMSYGIGKFKEEPKKDYRIIAKSSRDLYSGDVVTRYHVMERKTSKWAKFLTGIDHYVMKPVYRDVPSPFFDDLNVPAIFSSFGDADAFVGRLMKGIPVDEDLTYKRYEKKILKKSKADDCEKADNLPDSAPTV